MAGDPWAEFEEIRPVAAGGGGAPQPVFTVPDPAGDAEEARKNEAARLAQQRIEMEAERLRLEKERAARESDPALAANEAERKAAAFLIRALGSNDSYEAQEIGARSLVGQKVADAAPNVLNSLPGFIGNSAERQVADSAQDEFIAASLRQDSGAVIPPEEMTRQRRIYFPMPGDGPAVIEAKRQARLRAIEGLKQSSGRMAEEAISRFHGLTPQDGLTGTVTDDSPGLDVTVTDDRPANPNPSVDGDSPGYEQVAAGTGDVVEGFLNNTIGLAVNPVGRMLYEATGYGGQEYNLGQIVRDALGLPEGDPRIGAIVQAAAGGGGAAAMAGYASKLLGTVAGGALSASLAKYGAAPIQDMAAGGAAAASGELAKAAGVGPVGQTAAMLAGGGAGAAATARTAPLRAADSMIPPAGPSPGGGTPAERYARGQEFGIDLSPGDAGGMTPKVVERILDVQPGSASVMNSAREATLEQSERAVGKVADTFGPATSFPGMGEAAQRGVKGWKARFDTVASKAYDAIPIKPGTAATLGSTVAALEALTSKITSNPKLAAMLSDSKLTGYLDALKGKAKTASTGVLDASGEVITKQVTEGGNLSWNDLKQLRSRIGEEIGEQRFGEGTLKSDLRRLYAALSDDMEATAKAQGPSAIKAFERANNLFREGQNRLDRVWVSLLGPDGNKSPESAAAKVQQIARDGKSSSDLAKLAELRKTLKPDEWGEIANASISLLGRPMNIKGRQFAVDTFFRNYNGMAPEAKNLLFGGANKELRANLDKFAAVMADLAASKGTRNTSGTGAALAGGMGLYAGGVPALLWQAATSYGAAKLWTHPGFIRWATGYAKMLKGADKGGVVPPAVNDNQLASLGRLASSNSVIASDAIGLQSQLAEAFASTPRLAAQPGSQSEAKPTTGAGQK